MIDPNLKDTIAKAYAKIGDIAYSIALNIRKSKDKTPSQLKLYEQGIKMSIILKVLTRQITFDEITNLPTLYRLTEEQVNKYIRCLIKLGELNKYPIVPSLIPNTRPIILNEGLQGNPGVGTKGDKGDTGLATDFLVTGNSLNILVDSFPIGNSKAARWDYLVVESLGASRAGTIIGHWNSDGSLNSLSGDITDDDLINTTDGIELSLQTTSSVVYLIATITSGTWTISGSRYFIPNNGNGTGPISGLLPNGKVYIGNILNKAQDQFLSGAIFIDNSGIVTINNDYIVDSMISTIANISTSKLAPLSVSKLVVTDINGLLSTINTPNLTTLSYLDATSSIQNQFSTKITDPTTSIGDIIIRNTFNVISRLGIGTNNQVLTVIGGIPTWQNPVAGFSDPMTTIGDIMIRNASNITQRLGIGLNNQVLTISGGLPVWQNPVVSGGTVTSIGAIAPASGFTISGSPITNSGSFTFTLNNDLAAVEALNTTGLIRRTAPNTWSAGGLTQINEGGTNISSYTTGDIPYSSSTDTLSKLGIGTLGQVLGISAGLPSWVTLNGSQWYRRYTIDTTSTSSFTIPTETIIGTYQINILVKFNNSLTIILPPYSNSIFYRINIVCNNNANNNQSIVANGTDRIYNINGLGGYSSILLPVANSGTAAVSEFVTGENSSIGTFHEVIRTPITAVLNPTNVSVHTSNNLNNFTSISSAGIWTIVGSGASITGINPDPYFKPKFDISFGFNSTGSNVNLSISLQRSTDNGSNWTIIKTSTFFFAGSEYNRYASISAIDSIDSVNNRIYRVMYSFDTYNNARVTTLSDYCFTPILGK